MQVPVIDADQRRREIEGEVELGAIMHFGEHRHSERGRYGLQLAHLRQLERRHDEQNAICTHGARFVQLVGVDHEILAQHWEAASRARSRKILGTTLKKTFVGEHREAGRAVLRVGAGDRRRIESLAKNALARTRLLDLGDHRRQAGGDFRAQCADKIPRFSRRFRLVARGGRAQGFLGLCDFLGLDREDLVQDISHARVAG